MILKDHIPENLNKFSESLQKENQCFIDDVIKYEENLLRGEKKQYIQQFPSLEKSKNIE